MSTVIEPSTTVGGQPQVQAVPAYKLEKGMMVTNTGLVESVGQVGVFVIAAIKGTVWSLASGMGDVHTLDVVWHETQTVTVDKL